MEGWVISSLLDAMASGQKEERVVLRLAFNVVLWRKQEKSLYGREELILRLESGSRYLLHIWFPAFKFFFPLVQEIFSVFDGIV